MSITFRSFLFPLLRKQLFDSGRKYSRTLALAKKKVWEIWSLSEQYRSAVQARRKLNCARITSQDIFCDSSGGAWPPDASIDRVDMWEFLANKLSEVEINDTTSSNELYAFE